MPSILDKYWFELRGKFDRLPVWLPGTPMRLGDIGVFEERGWSRITSLQEKGIEVVTDSDGVRTSYSYSSRSGAEVKVTGGTQAGAGVSMLAGGSGKISMRFNRAGAFVLIADDVEVHRVRGLEDVDRSVLSAYESGAWRPDWTFVSEVAIAARSLIVVAGSSQAQATVAVEGKIPAGVASSANADAGLRFSYKRDLEASFVTVAPSAVMWRGRYVRDPVLRRAGVAERGRSSVPIDRGDRVDVNAVYEVEYPSDIVSPADDSAEEESSPRNMKGTP